jgi:hypothetical protein
MQAFREHIEAASNGGLDAVMATEGGLDAVDFYEPGVRDAINLTLLDITDGTAEGVGEPAHTTDPVVLYERVRAVIADAGYLLPSSSSLLSLFSEMEPDGDEAFALTRIKQFEPNEPEVVPCYLYFAFCKDEAGYYDVLAEVVTQDELEEILHGEDAETV